jgi:hypothetical protein
MLDRLPDPLLRLIQSNFENVKDKVRFSSVNKATRRTVDITHVRVILEPTYDTLCSFAEWLCVHVETIESLDIMTDLMQWSTVWHFYGYHICPKLAKIRLTHTTGTFLIMTCPENFLPISPAVRSLEITGHMSLHVGEGFSRFSKMQDLVLQTPGYLWIDAMALAVPYLRSVKLVGEVRTPHVSMSGLSICALTRLECPASVLFVVKWFEKLEKLVLSGSTTGVADVEPLIRPSSVELVCGRWPSLHWLPRHLKEFKIVACCVATSVPRAVRVLSVIDCAMTDVFANSIAALHLDKFVFYSLSCMPPVKRMSVRAVRYEIPDRDLSYFDFLC